MDVGRLRYWTDAVWSIINLQTIVTAAAACLATWLCGQLEWYAEFPLTLVSTAVIFPIVFSIGGAYKRRESALDDYGDIKAHSRALYFASRDWFDDTDIDLQNEMRQRLFAVLDACRHLFTGPVNEGIEREQQVYAAFSDLSVFVNSLRDRGLPAGEASRCNQFLSKMVISFEHIKHVYQYRTPQTLRAYSKLFLFTLPVVYGPYFAHQALDYRGPLTYVMPVLVSLILVSLDNIQEHLENPFDRVGPDDVMINAEKLIANLVDAGHRNHQ